MTALSRDKNHPWKLKTAPGTSDTSMGTTLRLSC